MSERDIAATLRLRSEAIKDAARHSYDYKLREVMYQTALTFDEAATEIERLRRIITDLGSNYHTT